MSRDNTNYDDILIICKNCELFLSPLDMVNHSVSCKSDKHFIDRLKEEIISLKFQNKMLSHIVKQNTNIPLDSVMNVKDNDICITDLENCSLSVVVKDLMQNVKRYELCKNTPLSKISKKPIYRTIKGKIEHIEENPEIKNKEIKRVDREIQTTIEEKFETKEKILEDIENCFNELKIKRIYRNTLKNMKSIRKGLISRISIFEYEIWIKSHFQRLKLFIESKGIKNKKLKEILNTSLSTLDLRFLRYDTYFQYSLNQEEIKNVKWSIKYQNPQKKEFIPFSKEDVFKQFHNYAFSILPLWKMVEYIFFNRYKFNNIIYLNVPKSTDEDPYSFYILDSINNDIRNWGIQHRLGDLCIDFCHNLKLYGIELFRKVYFDVYQDNEFRDGYMNGIPLFEQDTIQLLKNIKELLYPILFRNKMRKLVKSQSTYTPSDLDKFHIISDDPIQKRALNKENQDDNELLDVADQLFDTISENQKIKFWDCV